MKIKDRKIKNKSSGSYERLIGNQELALLISKIQSAVIAQGKELENDLNHWIEQKYPNFIINTLNDFLNIIAQKEVNQNFYILDIKIYKQFLKNQNIENIKNPDFIFIFIINRTFYVVELKEGYDFDTKKSAGEKISLEKIQNDLQNVLTDWTVNYYFCSFYAESKEQVFKGLKKKFLSDNLWTGKDFFHFIKLNYQEFVNWRNQKLKSDQQENIEYIRNFVININV